MEGGGGETNKKTKKISHWKQLAAIGKENRIELFLHFRSVCVQPRVCRFKSCRIIAPFSAAETCGAFISGNR